MNDSDSNFPIAPRPPRSHFWPVRDQEQRRHDQRVRSLARKLRLALPWLEDADIPAVRAWCELELLAQRAWLKLTENGASILTPKEEPRGLLDAYQRLRKTQLQFERELGMTPRARMEIKTSGTRAALDLAGQLASLNAADREGGTE
jgi:phage terminase small subunit